MTRPNPRTFPIRDVSREVSVLFEYSADLPRTTLIPHEKIEELTGVRRIEDDGVTKNPVYNKIIHKWKNRMLNERGIFPWSSYGVGYKLPTVEEQQQKIPDIMEASAARKVGKAKAVVASIHADELSDTQKAFGRERVRQDDETLQVFRRNRAQRRSYLANPDTLPRYKGNGRE